VPWLLAIAPVPACDNRKLSSTQNQGLLVHRIGMWAQKAAARDCVVL
jgi:hypothetical protein